MRHDEVDLRSSPLWERKRELQKLVLDADEHQLRFSDDFDGSLRTSLRCGCGQPNLSISWPTIWKMWDLPIIAPKN